MARLGRREELQRLYVREFGGLEGVLAHLKDVGGVYRDGACEGDAFPGGVHSGRGRLSVDGGRGRVEEGAVDARGCEWDG